MKTILTLFLLPISLIGQIPIQQQFNNHQVGFSLDVMMEYQVTERSNLSDNTEGIVEVTLTVEVFYEEFIGNEDHPDFTPYASANYILPRHLSTYSLMGFHPGNTAKTRSEKSLDDLYVFNDQTYPEQNTFFNWLNPVRHHLSKVREVKYLPIGFGPSISL